MEKPVLLIVNGLPGSGKTTLAKRLAVDLQLPVFSRDSIYETLYDALECQNNGVPPLMAPATFTFLYYIVGSVLAARQSLIVEGFFGRPELRSNEFLQVRRSYDFAPLQIMCKADGAILLERFLARARGAQRHSGHSDLEWLEENRERLLQGELSPLSLPGPVIEMDTTPPESARYADLLQQVRAALAL